MNYDIWMGNDRGNRYSLNHTTYDPFGSHSDRRHYWSFSWHEIGTIDLPTMIDYVLATTGQLQLQYIAHSQGTTAAFVMTSERPEYNDKIQMMHALAPIAYLSHVISPPIRVIVPFISIAEVCCVVVSHILSVIQLNMGCRNIASISIKIKHENYCVYFYYSE